MTLSKQIGLLLTANRKGAEEVQRKQLGKDVVGLYVIGSINIHSPTKMFREWLLLKCLVKDSLNYYCYVKSNRNTFAFLQQILEVDL